MPSLSSSTPDWLRWIFFELGAGYYTRKLATGPETELRRNFTDFLTLPRPTLQAQALRILDVGCGPGHVARELARQGYEVTGVDRSWRLLRLARRWAAQQEAPVKFFRASVEHLPFAAGSFDCALAIGVVYLVKKPQETLQEMMRVTRSGGIVASMDPGSSMSVAHMREYCHEMHLNDRDTRKLIVWAASTEFNRRFEEQELRQLLSGAGLADLRLESRLGGMVWFAKGIVPRRG